MGRPLVLDTSAILVGIGLPPGSDAVVPDAVESEIQPGGAARRRFEMLVEAGLRVMRPGKASRDAVAAAARRTGDDLKLSPVDIDVLALAHELSGEIVTDDYAIQNVAAAMGMPARRVSERGIKAQWRWVPACTGCGRRFEQAPPGGVCPVCGHQVRARRSGGPPSP